MERVNASRRRWDTLEALRAARQQAGSSDSGARRAEHGAGAAKKRGTC
jgi:hypothetical protein